MYGYELVRTWEVFVVVVTMNVIPEEREFDEALADCFLKNTIVVAAL